MKSALRSASCLQALSIAGVAGIAMVAAPAAAQDYTAGAMSGTVTDEDGNPVAGATVTVTSVSQGFSRTATTGANGGFRVNNLPTGAYDVVVGADGYQAFTATGVSVLAGETTGVTLPLSTGNEIVVIGVTVTQPDFEGTTTGLNVDVAELQKRVPLPRDLTSVVLLAPGTTQGDSAFGNLASIGGSSVAENAYYVNGLNTTNFDNYLGSARVPFDFYRSVEVKSGGYPAEYGRATGGIVNAVTKSGSNQFFGAVRLDASPDWAGSDGNDLETCSFSDPTDNFSPVTCRSLTNREADSGHAYSAVIEAGLPIIKDMLFVYGLVEFREVQSITVNRSSGLATKSLQDDPFWGAKVDFYPIDSQHLEFTIFDTRRTTDTFTAPYAENANGYTIGNFDPAGVSNFGGLSYVGKYTGTFTDWFTLSASYGVMEDRFDNVGSSTLPFVTNASGSTQNGVPNGGLLNDQTVASISLPYNTRREFYRADADIYFEAFGEHHIRFGFDQETNTLSRGTVRTGGDYLLGNGLISSAAYNAGAGSAGIAYVLRSGGIVELNYFNSGGAFESVNRAFYIQDEWQVTDRLTLSLGLRRDDFSLDKADGTDFLDLDENYAPRVGFTYDVGDNGKLFGFFGQYFLPVASNTAFRGAGSEFFFRERFRYSGFNSDGVPIFTSQITSANDPNYGNGCPFGLTPFSAGGNTCRVTGDGSVPSSEQFFAANLKATKQSEYIIGYEHNFGGFNVGLSYTRRTLDRTAEDAAIDIAVLNYCTAQGITGCEDVWTGFHQYVTYNIGGPLTITLLGNDALTSQPLDGKVITLTEQDLAAFGDAIRKYDSVELTFDRPWDGTWSLGGSYTWSNSRGNSEGYVQSDFGQDDAGITQDFDQPGFTDFAYGKLPNHRRHRFRLFGAVSPIENFIVGTNVSVESPRPLSCFGYHPTDVFANVYDEASHYCNLQPAVRGEGSKTDWESTIDLSMRYVVDFESGPQVSFNVDVFNLFDSQAVTSRNEIGDFEVETFNALGQPTLVSRNPNYDNVTGYQAPRSVRFGVDIEF